MLDLPSLITGARRELGLPERAPAAAPATDAPLLRVAGEQPLHGSLPAVAAAPTAPATPVAPRTDAIHETLRDLGSRLRPAAQALADVANGTATVLDPAAAAAAPGARQAAAQQLTSLFVESIEHGEAAMPRAPRTDGNRVDLLVRNEQYLPRLYEDLESATRSITVNQFNWEPDGSGAHVAQVLERKAREGLDVRVTVDGYGINERGKDAANALQQRLEAAGVKFVRTGGLKPFGSGWEHRKLITIDDRVAFMGGLGFGQKYDTWTDLMVRVEGPGAAVAGAGALGTFRTLAGQADATLRQRAQGIAAKLQDAAQGVRELVAGPPRSQPLADARAAVTILENRPGADLASTEAFLRDVAAAKERLWATSTYITTPVAKDALIDAARRGVDVKILMTSPHAGNDTKQIHLGRTMYGEMIDAGIEVFEWPGILHSKSWLKDDDVAAVGSMNLSKSSMARAREITARVEDPAFAERYARFHEETRAGAHMVQKHELGSVGLKALGVLTKLGLQF